MTLVLIARGNVVGVKDDLGLKALDEFYKSPSITFKDDIDFESGCDKMLEIFEDNILRLFNPDIRIVRL